MSLHIFGAIVTHHGTAANNRAETEGNITTLQKLLWHGHVHSTVSAEAIRFALRRRLEGAEPEGTNRRWVDEDDEIRKPHNKWRDEDFKKWSGGGGYIDDDLLGFMSAEAAKEDGSDVAPPPEGRKPRAKGTATIRRSPLEITRAISLIPWGGDVTFNAASPGATPSAQKGGRQAIDKPPVPYGTEVHATRYQYGFALTPGALRKPERATIALEALCALGEVAGNHARFLYDFSPESVVFRITDDPAPRLLYIFEQHERDRHGIRAPALLTRVESGDIPADELIIGGSFSQSPEAREMATMGEVTLESGVRNAVRLACERITAALKKTEG